MGDLHPDYDNEALRERVRQRMAEHHGVLDRLDQDGSGRALLSDHPAEDALVVTVRADDLRAVLKCADYMEDRSLIAPVDRIADALALVQTRADLTPEDAREVGGDPCGDLMPGDEDLPLAIGHADPPYGTPAEDAREARLSEGEVERLADALVADVASRGYEDQDAPKWWGWFITHKGGKQHTVDLVADMLTQREREVVARVKALALAWMQDETRSAQYQDGRADCAEDLRRALGGTADGQKQPQPRRNDEH